MSHLRNQSKGRKFYVYTHSNAEGVFYVGKGSGYRSSSKSSRNAEWKVAAKDGFDIKIVADGMPERCSMTLEKILIDNYGVENLVNRSTGGEGGSGAVRSDETKRLMSISKMGNKSRTGIKHSDDAKRKNGDKHRGKFVSQETRKRIGDAFHDPSVIKFRNDDGREYIGTRRDFIKAHDMHKGAVWGLIKGKSKHVKGWRLA